MDLACPAASLCNPLLQFLWSRLPKSPWPVGRFGGKKPSVSPWALVKVEETMDFSSKMLHVYIYTYYDIYIYNYIDISWGVMMTCIDEANASNLIPREFGPRPLPLALWFAVALVLLRQCSAEALTATCKELHVSSLAKMAPEMCRTVSQTLCFFFACSEHLTFRYLEYY